MLFVTQVAIDYRNAFKKDVVIDLVCYRRRGHNEADEPSGTQPLMYEIIKNLPTTRTLYAQRLIQEKVISDEQSRQMDDEFRDLLDRGEHGQESGQTTQQGVVCGLNTLSGAYLDSQIQVSCEYQDASKDWQTAGCDPRRIRPPASGGQDSGRSGEDDSGAMPINWGYAEVMAYATLLSEGHDIRITGQDVGRAHSLTGMRFCIIRKMAVPIFRWPTWLITSLK